MGDRGRALGAAAPAAAAALERPRERAVQLGALARAAGRRARPRAAARGGACSRRRRARRCGSRPPRAAPRAARAVEPRDLREHRVVELAGRPRQHAHDLLRVVAEPLDPQRERVGQVRRQRAAPVESGGEQLLREQRVALAAGVEALDQRRLGRRAEDVRELLGQLVAREAPRSIRSARTRSSSASSGRSGWRRCSSSGR